MLGDFFRINMPYGIARNEKGEWMAFNREYMPLGYNDTEFKKGGMPHNGFLSLPIYTRYRGLTERILLKIAARDGEAIKRNEKGEITEVWLYNDATNPMNQTSNKNSFWKPYWEKLEILSKLTAS